MLTTYQQSSKTERGELMSSRLMKIEKKDRSNMVRQELAQKRDELEEIGEATEALLTFSFS